MKTITATRKGIAINYENNKKSSFISYDEVNQKQNQKYKDFFEMNIIQRNMYRRLFYGLQAYSNQEVQSFTKKDIIAISHDHNKAQNIINSLKYDRLYNDVNKLLAVIFPHVKLDFYKDGHDVILPSLKSLKITTVDIIDKWIEYKLLPNNFYSINTDNLNL